MYTIMDFDGKRAWSFRPTHTWMRRYPNYHAVSIGYRLGEDISQRQLDRFLKSGIAAPMDYDKANHSGCQSSCKRRGGEKCQW